MKTAANHPVRAKVGPKNPFFEIVEEAFRVFDYPKPRGTGVCRMCCMDEPIERDFFNPPIAELPLAYLQDWYFAACDPAGVEKAVWAYLLPRILEVLATGEDVASVGLEVALDRFDTGNPENWNAGEWAVLDAFQKLFLRLQLERSGPFARAEENMGDYLDDVVCMFARGGWAVDDLVIQLLASDAGVLARRMYRDWSLEHYRDCGAIWITAFWEGEGREKAWSFYTSQALHDRMAKLALDGATDPALAEQAYHVANVIRANQDRRG